MKTVYIYLSCILLILSGCSDWLSEDGAPKMDYDFYKTEEGMDAALVAAYSYLRLGASGEHVSSYQELGTDLFTEGSAGSWRDSFDQYGAKMNADNSLLYKLWQNNYKGIGTCNIAMEEIEKSTEVSLEKKTQSLGELHFIRAFMYFELVQQFGRIPLVLKGSYEARTDFQRSSVSQIYQAIITDLRYAIDNLTSPDKLSDITKGKANSFVAAHLLAKVYLTRASGEIEDRGKKDTDLDSVLYYSKEVIEKSPYKLLENYSDLWDINNQGNSEVIFAVQYTTNPLFNGDGNWLHLFWGSVYDNLPGMKRTIEYGRPYNRLRPTDKTLFELFDRQNDSRFYKSFRWVFYANNSKTIPKWAELKDNGKVYFTPDPDKGQIKGKAKFALGDTAVYYSVQKTGFKSNSLELKKYIANYSYSYYPYEAQDLKCCPTLLKHFAPNRTDVAQRESGREWVRMRLGETYLIAAEAAGRKGDFELATTYINVIRERAAWADNETKAPQYWTIEKGDKNDTHSTFDKIKVTKEQLAASDFISFMLDERGRELLGETCRWEDLVRCEKLYDWVKEYNPNGGNIQKYHKLRPIPQNHINRLKPAGVISEEQNEGYY